MEDSNPPNPPEMDAEQLPAAEQQAVAQTNDAQAHPALPCDDQQTQNTSREHDATDTEPARASTQAAEEQGSQDVDVDGAESSEAAAQGGGLRTEDASIPHLTQDQQHEAQAPQPLTEAETEADQVERADHAVGEEAGDQASQRPIYETPQGLQSQGSRKSNGHDSVSSSISRGNLSPGARMVAKNLKGNMSPGVAVAWVRRISSMFNMQRDSIDDCQSPNPASAVFSHVSNAEVQNLRVKAQQPWRSNRQVLERSIDRVCLVNAYSACAGTCCAVAQNELVFLGTDPESATIDCLKALNTLLTLICCLGIIYFYWLSILLQQLEDHLHRGRSIKVVVATSKMLGNIWLLMELAVCAIHLPPFITYEAEDLTINSTIVYRSETMFCAWNVLRLYLFWRVIRASALSDLPGRHTVSMLASVQLGSSFAFKRLLNSWRAILWLTVGWALTFLVMGYWYRSAEVTACFLPYAYHHGCSRENARFWTLDGVKKFEKQNDFYMQNAAWLIFITSTGVGYGDTTPVTHLSRTVAAVAGFCGIIMAALLTASLRNILNFSAHEHFILKVMEREKAKADMQVFAGHLILAWWKKRKRQNLRSSRHRLEAKKRFMKARMKARMDLDEMAQDFVKLVQVSMRVKFLESAITNLNTNVRLLTTEHCFSKAEDLLRDIPDQSTEHEIVSPPPQRIRPMSARSEDAKSAASGQEGTLHDKLARVSSFKKRLITKTTLSDVVGVVFVNQTKLYQMSGDPFNFRKKGLDLQLKVFAGLVSLFSIVGMACSILQHELIFRGSSPDSSNIDLLKTTNSVTSFLAIVFLLRYYMALIHFKQLIRHLYHGYEINTRLGSLYADVAKDPAFWMEALICGLHLPPFFTFEIGGHNLDNVVVYRAETAFCLLNTLRLYSLLRVLRDWLLGDLPQKSTMSNVSSQPLGYAFALKRMLTSEVAIGHVCIWWVFSFLLTGYWLKLSESSACTLSTTESTWCEKPEAFEWTLYGSPVDPTRSTYLLEAIWLMVVTSTTVGYGDFVPITHLGRLCAAISAITGVILGSLLTTVVITFVSFTPAEESALHLLEREKARKELLQHAASMVQIWWMKRAANRVHKTKRAENLRDRYFKAKKDFQLSRKVARQDLSSVPSWVTQVNSLFDMSRESTSKLESVADAAIRLRYYLTRRSSQVARAITTQRNSEGHIASEKEVFRHFQEIADEVTQDTLSETGKASINSHRGERRVSRNSISQLSSSPSTRKRSSICSSASSVIEVRGAAFGNPNPDPPTHSAKEEESDMDSESICRGQQGTAISTERMPQREETDTTAKSTTIEKAAAHTGSKLSKLVNGGSTNKIHPEGGEEDHNDHSSSNSEDRKQGESDLGSGQHDEVAGQSRPNSTNTKSGGVFKFSALSFTHMLSGRANARKFRTDRQIIAQRVVETNSACGLAAACGVALAVAQNEMVFRGFDPKSTSIECCKGLNSFMSLVLMCFVFRFHWLGAWKTILTDHIERGGRYEKDDSAVFWLLWANVIQRRLMWFELVVCGVHLPPGITFEVEDWQVHNFALIRAETLFCIINSFRLYLLWRVTKDWALSDLPSQHAIEMLAAVKLGSRFAIKRLLASRIAGWFLACLWAGTLVLLGYWHRSAEATACLFGTAQNQRCHEASAWEWTLDGTNFFTKTNDLYLQNAIWQTFVTATSVGYGDTAPVMLGSKIIQSLSALTGILFSALLTAALQNLLHFSPDEHAVLMLLEGKKVRDDVKMLAATLVGRWWRARARGVHRRKDQSLLLLIQTFKRIKNKALLPSGYYQPDNLKVISACRKMRKVDDLLSTLSELLHAIKTGDQSQSTPFSPAIRPKSPDLQSMGQVTQIRKNLLPMDPLPQSPNKEGTDPLPLSNGSATTAPLTEGEPIQGVPEDEDTSPFRVQDLSKPASAEHTRTDGDKGAEMSGTEWGRVVSNIVDSNISRRKERLEAKLRLNSLASAVLATLGSLAAVIQNELIYDQTAIHSWKVEALKCCNSFCTLGACLCLVQYYRMTILHQRLVKHLYQLVPLETKHLFRGEVIGQWRFWFEFALTALHLPPGVTFEVGGFNLDNFIVYRAESILCIINSLRLHLWARVIRNVGLRDLPHVSILSNISNRPLNYSFVLKRLLTSKWAIVHVSTVWGFSFLICGYWYRCAELSVCQLNTTVTADCLRPEAQQWTLYGTEVDQSRSQWIQQAMWVTVITSTMVGYGDIFPVTHFGRFFASLACITGLLLGSLLTAVIMTLIARNPAEEAALHLLEREKAKKLLMTTAAKLLQLWWRHRKLNKMGIKRNASQATYMLLQQLRSAREASKRDVSDLQSTSARVNDILMRASTIHSLLKDIVEEVGLQRSKWSRIRRESVVDVPSLEEVWQGQNHM